MKRLILASGSSRRKELLQQVNIPFEVKVSSVEETFDENDSPENIAMKLAYEKAKDVSRIEPSATVLGADTIVVLKNKVLGKPKDESEAYSMLSELSGQTHHVITGVAIVSRIKEKVFFEKTSVTFYELSKEEIEQYIESKEPMDKAGAYGIQQLGALFVKKIEGDYFSVVGLPVARTVRELSQF